MCFAAHLEGVRRLGVKRANGGVEATAIVGTRNGFIEGTAERVEGDVDRPAVGARFLLDSKVYALCGTRRRCYRTAAISRVQRSDVKDTRE